MSYNDLSDNGKSFEFGYDSENDTYGYYKNGVFTGFGGGGVSTKCIIKGAIFMWWRVGDMGKIYTFDTDGSYYVDTASRYADINTTYQTACERLSFIKSASFTPNSGYTPTEANIVVDGGGYFTWSISAASNQMTPMYVQDGDRIPTGIGATGAMATIMYYGMEIPS